MLRLTETNLRTNYHICGHPGNLRRHSSPDRCKEMSVPCKEDLFDIKIHDFFFHEDQCLDMNIPPCISTQRYDSISGEELSPYRRLSAGDIQTIVGASRATGSSSTSASPSTPWGWKFSPPIMRIF